MAEEDAEGDPRALHQESFLASRVAAGTSTISGGTSLGGPAPLAATAMAAHKGVRKLWIHMMISSSSSPLTSAWSFSASRAPCRRKGRR